MYHFIGIKGSGMSALAQIMHELGYQVQGSDVDKEFFTEIGLKELGINIFPFNEDNINEDLIIVRGTTFNEENNEEVRKAKELNLPIFTYNEMVGKLTRKYETICVAGCHGKTTTTSMIAHIFDNLVGANYLIGDGTGHAAKENKHFILEACEYKRHFLLYQSVYAIITNIELDHVDYFKDMDDVILAYQEYSNLAEKMVIACGDDPYTRFMNINRPIFFYGIDDDNDIQAKNIKYHDKGTSFEVFVEGNYYGFFDLPIFGKHLLLDALAAISVCYYERMEAKEVNKIFKTYKGAKRRYTEKLVADTVIVDDYAHHPTEVKATIKATKQKYPDKKIVAVFQPHTYSRTEAFFEDLIEVLKEVDYTYLLPIHPSREKQEDYPDITNENLIKRIKNAESITLEDAFKLVKWKGSVVLFMSPNDLSKIEDKFEELLKEQ